MKMINDMDMYYASAYTKDIRPMWMKDERIEYCENTKSNHGVEAFLSSLFQKKHN